MLVLLGVVDLLVQRKQFNRELSMSVDEVRREERETEGDPRHRAARRSIYEAQIMQDIVSRVRRSKVILVEKL